MASKDQEPDLMWIDPEHEFRVVFDSADAFDKAFERRGPETGLFFRSVRNVNVGERVWIRVSVKGEKNTLFLEGRVLWRRVRPGGPDMPAGTFVGLVERERAHLNAIIRYLGSQPKRPERRKHRRYPIFFPGSYATSKGEFPTETRDLSCRGAFLRCRGPLFNIGAEFPLTLVLEDDPPKRMSIRVRVAWLDLFDETKGMGVFFLDGQPELKRVARSIDESKKAIGKKTKRN